MCFSLEHQSPSKTSEKMGYFDRVTVSLHILETANQETEGSQDRLTVYFVPRLPFGRRAVRQRGYGLGLLIFTVWVKMHYTALFRIVANLTLAEQFLCRQRMFPIQSTGSRGVSCE